MVFVFFHKEAHVAEMTDEKRRPGPRSRYRPKMYHRRVSAALTAEGWRLLDEKLERDKGSVSDWIESALRSEPADIAAITF